MPTPAHHLESAIRAANSAGRPALIPFLTAGYPHPDRFPALLAAVRAHADVLEIGVPFSDPMADGATIQRASRAALDRGVSLRWIFSTLAQTRDDHPPHASPAAPVVLMSYLNPLLAYGLDALPRAALDAGVSGFIIPDLPLEESPALKAHLDPAGLALIPMVTPVTPPDRARAICGAGSGFVYAVTITGITGATAATAPSDLPAYLDRLRALSPLPVCAGFGIRTPADAAALAPHADGLIIGSALIEAIERDTDPRPFLQSIRAALIPRAHPG